MTSTKDPELCRSSSRLQSTAQHPHGFVHGFASFLTRIGIPCGYRVYRVRAVSNSSADGRRHDHRGDRGLVNAMTSLISGLALSRSPRGQAVAALAGSVRCHAPPDVVYASAPDSSAARPVRLDILHRLKAVNSLGRYVTRQIHRTLT